MPGELGQCLEHVANILAGVPDWVRLTDLSPRTDPALASLHPHVSPLKTAPESEAPVPGLDPMAVRHWRELPRIQSPWLHEEVASRMAERLHWFRDKPLSWLHWEPLMGGLQAHRQLRGLLPESACFIAAQQLTQALQATHEPPLRSWNPLQWVRGKTALVAREDTRVDMLWANMALHLEPRPLALLQRWHGQIATNGFLMFSCLGPDTVRELRAVYAQAGWPAPAHTFTDMHDWGDMLVQSGFAEPVMDMERIMLSYSSAQALLNDLRELGRNLSLDRFPAARSRAWHGQLRRAIESGFPRTADGRLLLTVEVIYGHAFKPAPRVPISATSSLSVDDMRAMLRSGRQ